MLEDVEEQYFGKRRKEARKDRKIAEAKDRSKYKKSDHKKWLEGLDRKIRAKVEKRDLLTGRVLSIVAQGYVVEYQGNEFLCSLRGLLKKEKRRLKNIVTVGDIVLFERTTEGEGVVSYVKSRKSVLSRQDALTRKSEHILAANIDQVLITTSVVSPPLKPFLIDRYIIAAHKGRMDPVVVVNKIDLLVNDAYVEERYLYQTVVASYAVANIPVVTVSGTTEEGLDKLREAMKGKASVFSGQSGVGKSTLINALTGMDLPVGEVVEKTGKGGHTTARAHLIPLEFGGFCIDTPGIKSFGVWNLEQHEIESFYAEIHQEARGCKFPNCSHTHEEDCAVILAVQEGEISNLRYESYCQLFQTIKEEHLRR